MDVAKRIALLLGTGILLGASPSCVQGEPLEKVKNGQTGSLVSLEDYVRLAKEYESLITGEEPAQIPVGRLIVSSQKENEARVASIASQAKEGLWHTFYVIGKNTVPNGKVIARWYGDEAVYANLLEDVIWEGEDCYYISRMGLKKESSGEDCAHIWEKSREQEAGCLLKGISQMVCSKCGADREIIKAPLGHLDGDGDSICDRCQKRAFAQELGSAINVSLNGESLTFTCMDEDFQGGMLYLADQTVSLEQFGGYGMAAYGDSLVYRYFRDGFQNGFSIKKGLLPVQTGESGLTAYAMSLSKAEYEMYGDRIAGDAFLLRDHQEDSVWAVDEKGDFHLQNPGQTELGIRPAVVLAKPDPGTVEPVHWNLGELQAVPLDGNEYLFRCIDQNYSGGALFLCESVIPADYGSGYRLEQLEDGSYGYVFAPGPFGEFGEGNDYKYSNIHAWLEKQEIFNTMPVKIGSDYAFTGSSPEGARSGFDSNSLSAHYIGSQQLNARLFILSVDEALDYKEYLWRFEGADEENPETQASAYAKGYWLRSPGGNSEEFQTGYAYVVDLVNGNLHPAAVRAEGGTGEEKQDQTTVYGIRPAFVMPQD